MAHPTREAQNPSPKHALPTCEGTQDRKRHGHVSTTDISTHVPPTILACPVRVQPTERARSSAPRQPSHSPGGTARINCDASAPKCIPRQRPRRQGSQTTAEVEGLPHEARRIRQRLFALLDPDCSTRLPLENLDHRTPVSLMCPEAVPTIQALREHTRDEMPYTSVFAIPLCMT